MDTGFEFLRRLERGLTEVARQESRRPSMQSVPPKRRRHWRGWMAVAASLVALAGVIGAVIGTSNVRELAVSEGNASFSTVGSALDRAGSKYAVPTPAADLPEAVPPPASGGLAGFTNRDVQQGNGPAAPSTDLSKIIRDAEVALSIDDGSFSSRSADVTRIAIANRGSVLSSSTSGGDSGTFTLRIPAAYFDRAMTQLEKLGSVDSSQIHGQDVTAQFVDLKAHMKIYLARRRVLFGLMQQANSIGETLTVQRELDDVQLKIDQIKGQLNFINNQVAESTIKVDMHEPDAAVAPTPGDVERPSLGWAWDHAVQGFLNVLAAVVIGLGYLIPIGIVVAIGFLIVRLARRRTVQGR
jgi:hypothetical protein